MGNCQTFVETPHLPTHRTLKLLTIEALGGLFSARVGHLWAENFQRLCPGGPLFSMKMKVLIPRI